MLFGWLMKTEIRSLIIVLSILAEIILPAGRIPFITAMDSAVMKRAVSVKRYSLGEKKGNPVSEFLASIIQQFIQPDYFKTRKQILRIREEPRANRPKLMLDLGRFAAVRYSQPGYSLISSEISRYFSEEMIKLGLSPGSFEDLEQYFVKHVSNDEYYPAVFLYYMVNFDVNDRNSVVKNARRVFTDRQGECDDISMFIHYFALKKKISGTILGENLSSGGKAEGSPDYHAQYFYKDRKKIYILDNNDITLYPPSEFESYNEYLSANRNIFYKSIAIPYNRFKNGNRSEKEFILYVLSGGKRFR